MCRKWLCICGGTSEEQDGCKKQSTRTVKPVKHVPLPAVSGSQSLDAAAVTSDEKEAKDISEQDVNKAAEEFINEVHRAWELQRTLSDSRYNGYLERAMFNLQNVIGRTFPEGENVVLTRWIKVLV